METKICSRCDRELLVKSFSKDKGCKDGLNRWCKECNKEYKAQYYCKNKEYIKNKVRINQVVNKEKISIYNKEYCRINKGNLWRDLHENKERIVNKQNKYYQDHKLFIKIQTKQYKNENRVRYNISEQHRRALKRELLSTFTKEQWAKTKMYFNGKCAYCDKELPLTQEHFKAVTDGGEYTTNNIIPSCQHCNSSKNNKNFFIWYPKYKYYSKRREAKILKFLNYNNKNQQLTLTL